MGRRRKQSDWVFAGIALAVFALVAFFSYLEKGLAAGTAFYVFYTIIQTKAETRKESLKGRRFWLIIIILALIHIMAISLIQIPKLKFGLMVLPFALADGFAMWWLINWIEQRVPVGKAASDQSCGPTKAC